MWSMRAKVRQYEKMYLHARCVQVHVHVHVGLHFVGLFFRRRTSISCCTQQAIFATRQYVALFMTRTSGCITHVVPAQIVSTPAWSVIQLPIEVVGLS